MTRRASRVVVTMWDIRTQAPDMRVASGACTRGCRTNEPKDALHKNLRNEPEIGRFLSNITMICIDKIDSGFAQNWRLEQPSASESRASQCLSLVGTIGPAMPLTKITKRTRDSGISV